MADQKSLNEKIIDAYVAAGFAEGIAEDIAYHMTVWAPELAQWMKFASHPEVVDQAATVEIIHNFLHAVPEHLAAVVRSLESVGSVGGGGSMGSWLPCRPVIAIHPLILFNPEDRMRQPQFTNLERVLAQYPGLDVRRIDLMIGEKALWGQGWGTRAIRLLVRLAFEHQGVDLLYLPEIADTNPRSRRAFEKNGFVVVQQLPQKPGGKFALGFDLALTRQQYERQQRDRVRALRRKETP